MGWRASTVIVLALGCGEEGASIPDAEGSTSQSTASSDSSGSSGPSSTGVTASTSTTSTTDATSTSVDSSSTAAPNVCGDGTLEGDEECDDGNSDDGDACSSTCELPFTVAWTHIVGGTDQLQDWAEGVAIDDDGSIYVVGRTFSFASNFDVWLRQYTPDGIEGWTFTFDGAISFYDFGSAVAVHPSGDLIVVGMTEGASNDVLVLRVAASDQSVVWEAIYDGAYDDDDSGDGDHAFAVAVDPGGDVLVAGRERGDDTHGIWLARYDADGNELWHVAYPTGTADEASGVVVGDAGLVWVAGTIDVNGSYSGWLGGYDGDGTLVEDHTFPFHDFTGLTLGSDGRRVLSGRRLVAGVGDAMATVLDEAAEPVWSLLHAGDVGGGDQFLAAAASTNGDVYVTGYEAVQHLGIDQDIIVARLSGTDGTPVWIDRYDGEIEMDDIGTGIAVAPDGSVVVVGYTSVVGGNRDWFIRKYVER